MKTRFNLDLNGNLKIWEFPIQGEEYICGADCSEGLEDGDPSCAQVIKRREFKQVAVLHGWMDPIDYGKDLNYLGWFYNTMLLAVERNQSGISTLDYLRSVNYPNIYSMQQFDYELIDYTERLGWITSGRTRGLIIDSLRDSVKEGSLILNDPETLAELKTFVRNPKTGKIKASSGNRDDRVISLAIGVYLNKVIPLMSLPGKLSYFEKRGWGRSPIESTLGRGGY